MPVYEYRCTNDDCGRDKFQRLVAIRLRNHAGTCPVCGRKGERIEAQEVATWHPSASKAKRYGGDA